MQICATRCLNRFPDAIVIVDGTQAIPTINPAKQRVIKGADSKYQSVAAASIIAKVFRDRYMIKVAADYMEFDLHRNMGYGTPVHIRQIGKHGICPEHRQSFEPIKGMLKRGEIKNGRHSP
jgi:ribonuclease HII